MRSPASNYPRQQLAQPAFWVRHLRLITFFVLAAAGMTAVFAYYSPGELAADSVAISNRETLMFAPLDKPLPVRPVIQRHQQSHGPLLVGLIAGHLGSDSGAECADGLLEVDVNEKLARQTAALLRERGIRVTVLQEFDARLANFVGQALLSIHADSCAEINDRASGYKIAHSSSPLAPRLAACITQAYQEATQLPYHANTVTEHMVDYHAFREISPATPAVIIEAGFLKLDRELLTDRSGEAAAGLSNGLLCYLTGERLGLETPTPEDSAGGDG